MKKYGFQLKLGLVIIAIMFLVSLFSCSEDEPETLQGCLTGVHKLGTDRELIRCCTREEYLAGSNVNAGGTANWSNYTKHQWEKCDQCK